MTTSSARIVAIVPAGGAGVRAGTSYPKQYHPLRGLPMLRWALRALLVDSRIEDVLVGVAPDDPCAAGALEGLARTTCHRTGGPTRAATVLATLNAAALQPHDWVLVHDAARPGLPSDALARLIDACLGDCGSSDGHAVGGLLAERVADTVKLAESDASGDQGVYRVPGEQAMSRVQRSIPREGLWLAQTPQMFRAGLLLSALQAAGENPAVTDEASAMELAGYHPLLIPGSIRNFKVTWPEHFELIEGLLGEPANEDHEFDWSNPGKGS